MGMNAPCYGCASLTVDGKGHPVCLSGEEIFRGLRKNESCLGYRASDTPAMSDKRCCTLCRIVLPIDAFLSSPKNKSGRDGYCRFCHSYINAEYMERREKAEEIMAIQKRYKRFRRYK